MLGAAVGSCLASSLLFCGDKMRAPVKSLNARVSVDKVRDEHQHLRIGTIRVTLAVKAPEHSRERFERCTKLFEDYCTVTASVRQGIPVDVVIGIL